MDKVDRAKWTASRSAASGADDESVLVSQAVEGDADAFGKLYERHMDAIYRYIYMRVGEPSQAEDMTEDVFVKAWVALPDYRPSKHPFTSWLYRIAHNLVVDHYRRKSWVIDSAEFNPDAQPDPAPSPEEKLVERQAIVDLAVAIRRLSEEEQQVIILRFVEGLAHRQVAEIIGKSEAASRVIQHRALAALADLLDKDGQANGE
ncbi:MAG: RNA polymerase sigma factor [Anaerolineales bacterium]